MRAIIMFILWCITPGQPLSYPIFGTKRYHRATSTGSGNGAGGEGSSSYIAPSTTYGSGSTYYNSMSSPSYYEQRQLPATYYSAPPNYEQNGYVAENGYYYYPRHAYHSYGMPTYRGDYKPSPYYYAPGPSYNYYDDRDVSSNPLDDLHEEILQEDERERQREMYPVVGEESWYENNRQQDDLTNNFLRNLIAYNRQLDEQRLQQQQKQHQLELQNEQAAEYDEYSELPPDYEYDPQDESIYDLKNYENPHISRHQQHSKFNEMTDSEDDEDERQLKSLANHNNNNNDQNHNKELVHENNFHNANNNWQHSSTTSGAAAYAQYDADPEYDDAWINWDRKRSRPMIKLSSKRDESIKDFNNRKPFPIVVKPIEKFKSTKVGIPAAPAAVASSTGKGAAASATSSTSSADSVSTFASSTTSQPKNSDKSSSGQKEIVLPRPATPVQHIFAQPVLDIIDNALKTDNQTENAENKRPQDDEKNSNIYDTIKELIAMQEQLGKNSGERSKFQKRFVSSEESLVHELNSLKRRSQ